MSKPIKDMTPEEYNEYLDRKMGKEKEIKAEDVIPIIPKPAMKLFLALSDEEWKRLRKLLLEARR